ncbi:protein-tyrosine phosphatase-like protein [Dichotomocladium elegans]|nr:protein-tyrosine phosphatase-like protein [Dichotomocladium elegans]
MSMLENRSMQEIIPRLFLGSATASLSLETLVLHGVTHVLSIGPFDPLFDSITYKIINEMDVPETNLIQYFNETYDFIQGGLDAGGVVLVHCQAGVSRSPAVVAAYLMRVRSLPAQQALDIIRDQRSFVVPNDGFLEQLDLYYELKYEVDVKHTAYRRYLVDGMAREQQGMYPQKRGKRKQKGPCTRSISFFDTKRHRLD